MIKNSFLSVLVLLILSGLLEVNAQSPQRNKGRNRPNTVKQPRAQKARAPQAKYRNLPRYRSIAKQMPTGYVTIAFGGINYGYHSGIYYRPASGGYTIVNAPVGIRLRTLPANHIRVVYGPSVYYYYYGSFYQMDNQSQEYYSVVPPVGATVDALPEGYEKVSIDGNTYYELEGCYYKANITENGEVWYEVVGQK